MKKIKEYGLTILLIVILLLCLIYYYTRSSSKTSIINVKLLPTIVTKLEDNSIYSPTIQLIWNDLKKENNGDVVFIGDENNQTVRELNLETFKEDDISDNLYYKKYGFATPSLKNEITEGIFNKFGETSSILDDFTFEENSKNYFFYSMLFKEFKFLNPFDKLNDDTFGIKESSVSKLDDNLEVLFYFTDSYAVLLKTTTGDEVILYKGDRSDSFIDTYNSITKNNKEKFLTTDTISIHNLDFKVIKEYTDLEGHKINLGEEEYLLDKVVQTIEFKIDNEGGRVKSEAGMNFKSTALENERHFDFTDNYMIFIKEENKEIPYLMININDIKKFS